jgi:hypothetical protein
LEGTLAPLASAVVDFATIPGTATFSDFTDTAQVLMFNAGALTRDVIIPITDDNIVEAVETFIASLTLTTNPDQRVDLDPPEADISILDPVDSECIRIKILGTQETETYNTQQYFTYHCTFSVGLCII